MATTCRVCGIEEESLSKKYCARHNLLLKLYAEEREQQCSCGETFLPAGPRDTSCGRCFARRTNRKARPSGTCSLCGRDKVYLQHPAIPVCFPCMTNPAKRRGVFAVCMGHPVTAERVLTPSAADEHHVLKAARPQKKGIGETPKDFARRCRAYDTFNASPRGPEDRARLREDVVG